MMKKKTHRITAILLSLLLCVTALAGCTDSTPTVEPTVAPTPTPTPERAIYVSTNGSDTNDGSVDAPVATPERAIELVRSIISEGLTEPVTVYFAEGTYTTDKIVLSEADSGTEEFPITYKAMDGAEVIFTNAVTITPDDFTKCTDNAILSRVGLDIRDNLYELKLENIGVTPEMLGSIKVMGDYRTSSKYTDKTIGGKTAQLYWNNRCQTLAKYPNGADAFCEIVKVIEKEGGAGEYGTLGGTIEVDELLADRMENWAEPEKAWAYGRFQWEWADASTPINAIDTTAKTIQFRHTSSVGYKKEGEFYVFNILEELDVKGEYYIDYDTQTLYLCPPDGWEDNTGILAVSTNSLLLSKEKSPVNNIRFDGITFTGSNDTAVKLYSSNIKVTNCTFMNVGYKCLQIYGTDVYVADCEFAYNLGSGVEVLGGDVPTLTPSNNVIENCYFHDSKNASRVEGVGNVIRNCEFVDCTYTVICYLGNYNIVEYNYIHNCMTMASDAGALYIGGTYQNFGSIIRYNHFDNIGNEKYTSSAVYLDDGMSGQTIYGNLFTNVASNAILVGGGSNQIIENNLMINCDTSIFYDQRWTLDGWASAVKKHQNGEISIVESLLTFPYDSELFKERFPYFANVTLDYDDYENPYFPANPAFSVVKHNLYANSAEPYIEDIVYEMSTVEENYVIKDESKIDSETYEIDDLWLRLRGLSDIWEQIPYEKIGRNK